MHAAAGGGRSHEGSKAGDELQQLAVDVLVNYVRQSPQYSMCALEQGVYVIGMKDQFNAHDLARSPLAESVRFVMDDAGFVLHRRPGGANSLDEFGPYCVEPYVLMEALAKQEVAANVTADEGGCACHATCETCGYAADPSGRADCVTCADGSKVREVYTDGTGICAGDDLAEICEDTCASANDGACDDGFACAGADCACDDIGGSCYWRGKQAQSTEILALSSPRSFLAWACHHWCSHLDARCITWCSMCASCMKPSSSRL